jgi:hypothetical protein
MFGDLATNEIWLYLVDIGIGSTVRRRDAMAAFGIYAVVHKNKAELPWWGWSVNDCVYVATIPIGGVVGVDQDEVESHVGCVEPIEYAGHKTFRLANSHHGNIGSDVEVIRNLGIDVSRPYATEKLPDKLPP